MKYTAAVITVSDKGYKGLREDTSGPMLVRQLEQAGYDVNYTATVPDEAEMIVSELIKCADDLKLSLVLTTGGTGFSPRDITPEATLSVVERETRGIPEAMRAESMKITPRGSLSRSAAGIRGATLIVNLPGSEKAARENLLAVLPALGHGLDMLASAGSADCAAPREPEHDCGCPHRHSGGHERPQGCDCGSPSPEQWLREAKAEASAGGAGMYLIHNGVVRETSKAFARGGDPNAENVSGMIIACDHEKLAAATEACKAMPGICTARVWVREGRLQVGDDIMLALVGGDIRPNVIAGLEALVEAVKTECITETELF